MKNKILKLEKKLKELSRFAVAFSGGVDSTFLLAMAKKINPEKLIAITVSSQFVPTREIEYAKKIARSIGVEHLCFDVDILKNKDVVQNTKKRCYHCKNQMFSLIKDAAKDKGINRLVHAINLDDLMDYRPGLKAADEMGFLSPLAEAGFTKQDIRLSSKQLNLETWDKPSQSCLATRIPYNEIIKAQDLLCVDKAELFLQNLGFAQVRVRVYGKMVKIEVEPHRIEKLLNKDILQNISKTFAKIGFENISIDIHGYKTGKMNDEIL